MKSIQTSSIVNTKTYESSASINLRPPPIDHHKSLDEEDLPKKLIVTKKPNSAPINAIAYSIADLQMATGSFSIENLIGEGSFGRVYQAQFDDGKVHDFLIIFLLQSIIHTKTYRQSIIQKKTYSYSSIQIIVRTPIS